MKKQKGVSTIIGVIIIFAVSVIAFGGVFAYQYFQSAPQPQQQLVGGDRDNHGCIGSAGYSWCEAKQKCLRTWEEPCETDQAAGWKTYTNTQYEFQIKYPTEWETNFSSGKACSECGETSVGRLTIGVGPRVSFGDPDKGLTIYIYDREKEKRYEEMKGGGLIGLATTQPNKIVTERERCLIDHIKDIKIGAGSYSGIEIYDAQNDCFDNIYQFVINGENFDYVITPLPIGGIGYLGYDGKLKVSQTLPEFNQILSTFKSTK